MAKPVIAVVGRPNVVTESTVKSSGAATRQALLIQAVLSLILTILFFLRCVVRLSSLLKLPMLLF